MAFRQECKINFVVGNKVKIIFHGNEFEGTVVKYESVNPPDSHVKLLNEETGEQYIIPINNSMVIVVEAPKSEADVEISENDMVYKKKNKK